MLYANPFLIPFHPWLCCFMPRSFLRTAHTSVNHTSPLRVSLPHALCFAALSLTLPLVLCCSIFHASLLDASLWFLVLRAFCWCVLHLDSYIMLLCASCVSMLNNTPGFMLLQALCSFILCTDPSFMLLRILCCSILYTVPCFDVSCIMLITVWCCLCFMLFHALLFSMLYSPPYETSLHAVCFPALFVVKCFMLIHDLCCSTGTLRWSYFTPSNFVVPCFIGPYYTISCFASSCFMLPHALLLHA